MSAGRSGNRTSDMRRLVHTFLPSWLDHIWTVWSYQEEDMAAFNILTDSTGQLFASLYLCLATPKPTFFSGITVDALASHSMHLYT